VFDVRLEDLRGHRVAVWGTGREGIAALTAVADHQPAGLVVVQDKVTFLANAWEGEPARLAPLLMGDDAHAALLAADVVVRSPVIGESHPWIAELRAKGTPVTGGTALWMAGHAAEAIAITGSKGKSTTTSLVSHLLAGVGRPNLLGGNIGVAVLSLPPADRYVLELSMYQCADLEDSPRIVGLTSLMPDHLDWTKRGTPAEYYAHKLNVVDHGPEAVVYNGSDPTLTAELATRKLPQAPTSCSRAPRSCSPGGTTRATCASRSACCARPGSTASPSAPRSPRRCARSSPSSTGSPRSRTRPG
jgi:UDP-N-acetylmuramoylalanine-D-glutamate ligase